MRIEALGSQGLAHTVGWVQQGRLSPIQLGVARVPQAQTPGVTRHVHLLGYVQTPW